MRADNWVKNPKTRILPASAFPTNFLSVVDPVFLPSTIHLTHIHCIHPKGIAWYETQFGIDTLPLDYSLGIINYSLIIHSGGLFSPAKRHYQSPDIYLKVLCLDGDSMVKTPQYMKQLTKNQFPKFTSSSCRSIPEKQSTQSKSGQKT